MYKDGVKKNNFFFKYGKKSSSRPFLAHSGGGQETILYLRVAPAADVAAYKFGENNSYELTSSVFPIPPRPMNRS